MDDEARLEGPRALWTKAIDEARTRGSSTVESEHLLLAVASDVQSPSARLLAAKGLDYEGIGSALRREREQSLAAAGIAVPTTSPTASLRPMRRPTWGASLRETMNRMRRDNRERRGRPSEVDVLRSLLSADLGTIPRLLRVAGVDRDELVRELGAL